MRRRQAVALGVAASFLVLAVFIPVQHEMSIRAEAESAPGGGMDVYGPPTYTEYPDGTRRYWEIQSGFVAGSHLIEPETGRVLSESTYALEIVDGQYYKLVVERRIDHTLWGRAKWYVCAASVACLIGLIAFVARTPTKST